MKKIRAGLFVVAFIATSQMFAAHWMLENDWNVEQYYRHKKIIEELEKHTKSHKYKLQSEATVRDYDVLQYDFELDWYDILLAEKTSPEQRQWNGQITITLKSKIDNLNAIELDAIGLEILDVRLAHENSIIDHGISPTPQIIENILTVPLSPLGNPLMTGEVIRIRIFYKYVNEENIGFNLYYKNDVLAGYKVEEQIAYTVNSPEYARYWFPCNDTPGDKARANLKVSVPKDFTVASNGNLDSIVEISTEDGRNISTYYWSDTTQIATFLINATASIYKEYSEWFKSPNIEDSIEIKYYVWENDYDGNTFNAVETLKRTVQMLEFFSNTFTDYPFCKYGTVSAHPFIYSAMENQTMTMINRQVLRWVSGMETVLAHEIAHQWFGDLVSSKNWNDIWFKEGAATWAEALWEVVRYQNENRYFSVMRSKAVNYFQNPAIFTKPIYGNPTSIIFQNPYVFLTYNKASWIYHQLNILLGEELNLSILRNLLNHFKFGNIDAYEFRDFYKEKTQGLELDFDIDLFFEQWLFGAGHPQYDCQTTRTKIENDDDEILYDVQLTITQTQNLENVAEVFKMPIYITFLKKQANNQYISVYSERVINDQKVQEYSFYNVPDFDICKVDTLRTLCQNINVVITNIDEMADKNKISVFPNPAISQNFIYVSKPIVANFLTVGIGNSEIEISNSLGIKIDISSLELTDKYQIDISKLPTGLYFVRFGNQIEKFTVVR